MNDKNEITFMQTRMIRLAAEEWHLSIDEVVEKKKKTKVFDYIEMAEGYSILEIPPMHGWVGKSIGQLAIRSRYHVSILGIKVNGHLQFLPHPDRILEQEDHLMIVGMKKDIDRILANID